MSGEPVFIFTSDMEWSSEDALNMLIACFAGYGVVPHMFVTHASEVARRAAGAGLIELGIHPNFRQGSTHGETVDDVVAHMFSLLPAARSFRSHGFVDSTEISRALYGHGIRYDSNLCLYLQPGLFPLRHASGLVRYPVFWEDDVHWCRGGSWSFRQYHDDFFSPGLKIINVHPLNYSLNIQDQEAYESLRAVMPGLTEQMAGRYACRGEGTATFLIELLDEIRRRGSRVMTLSSYHDATTGAGSERHAALI